MPPKRKFRNPSYSVTKNPLVKHFRKSQSKFPKNFLFRENRQKVKCCPTPYSRRSKNLWIIPFWKPSGRKTVQGNKFIFGRLVRHPSYNTIWKKYCKIMNFLPCFKTPEDSYLQHFHKQWNFGKLWRKKSQLGTCNFRRIIIRQRSPTVVVQHIKNPAWEIKKQPAERGKRAVHFRCFCIKCWNRHATAGNTNSMKLYLMCPNMQFFFQWRWI